MEEKIIKVYVPLLNEGSPTIRGTQAIEMGNNTCKILPTADYDPEDEEWEFLPNTIVKYIEVTLEDNEKILQVISNIG